MARLLRIAARGLLALVAFVALVYVVEDVVLRYRVSHGGSAQVFETLTIYQAGAVKGNKLEYYFDQPELQTCVHAVFPHLGDPPCWYARKHALKILSRLASPDFRFPASLPARPPHGARSTKLEVIWIPARSERYTGHFMANTPCTRSIVSRFSSSAAITKST